MHNSNNRTDTGPGSRPYRPARPTQTLTFQIRDRHRDRNQSTGISQPRNNTSTSSPPTATLLLHNRPWCGLRSRLGVVQLLTSGSVSTRLVNSALFLALLSSTAAVACASPVVVCVHAAAAGSCLPPRLRGWWLLPPVVIECACTAVKFFLSPLASKICLHRTGTLTCKGTGHGLYCVEYV